jgi:outer membrane protein assembly factor BamB
MDDAQMNLFRAAATAALFALSALPALAAPPAFTPLWTAEVHSMIESAPTIADLAGNGTSQVVVTAHEELVAIDGFGKELWRFRSKGRYMTYPAALCRPGKPALIFATDNTGRLTCVDGGGQEKWHADLKAPVTWCTAVVCDLDKTGNYAVLQGDESGTLSAFKAEDGTPLWQAHLKGALCSPAAGLIDGKASVVATTNAGEIALIDYQGNVKWHRPFSAACDTWQTSAPVLYQTSKGPRIAVGASDGRVTCLSVTGKPLWTRRTRGYVASSLSVGDMDAAGRADLFAITGTGMVYRFGEDGRVLWQVDMQGRTIGAGALMDLDGSGKLSYILSTQSGHLLAFDSGAHIVQEYQFPSRTINMTPAFGHLTTGSRTNQMVITGGESGKVFCFDTGAKDGGSWTSCRAGAAKTGTWLPAKLTPAPRKAVLAAEPTEKSPGLAKISVTGLAPRDQVITGNPVRLRIEAPTGTALPIKITAMCIRPDGSRQAAMTPVYGLDGEMELPVEAFMAGRYSLEWRATDSAGKLLDTGSKTLQIVPFEGDRLLVISAIARLQRAEHACLALLPLTASALEHAREAFALESAKVDALRMDLPGSESQLLAETPVLLKEARRLLKLGSACEQAIHLGSRTSILAFEANTWESADIDSLVPDTVPSDGKLSISRRIAPGAHDSVSVKLLNITNRPLTVQVSAELPGSGVTADLLHSLATPTKQGTMAWDALVELDESRTVVIPPLKTDEVWMTVHAGVQAPSSFAATLHFDALNGAGVLDGPKNALDISPSTTTATIQYKTLPLALAPSGAFRMCCWAHTGPAEAADLLAHGNNVFTVPGPDPVYTAANRLSGFNFTKMDEILNALHGHDVIVLVEGEPALKPAPGSEAYMEELKQFTSALKAHMKRNGLDTQHFALYPFDEPGGNGWAAIDGLAAYGAAIKATDPTIQIYIDGGGDLPMFEKVARYIDIWCPPIGMPADTSAEMQLIKGTGKKLWTYECGYSYTSAMDANLHDTNIFAEYRSAAMFALRWGAEGIGFWSYNIGQNPWERTATDYPLVYPGKTHPITSRRWEAVRQGIEEARLLIAIKQKAAAENASTALRSALDTLIQNSLPELVDRSHREVIVGLGRSAFSQSQNEQKYQKFLSELLDCAELAAGH